MYVPHRNIYHFVKCVLSNYTSNTLYRITEILFCHRRILLSLRWWVICYILYEFKYHEGCTYRKKRCIKASCYQPALQWFLRVIYGCVRLPHDSWQEAHKMINCYVQFALIPVIVTSAPSIQDVIYKYDG